MGKKVWIIGDPVLDEKPGMNQERGQASENKKKETAAVPAMPQKNPAISFSLSLLTWGGGHMYIGQYRPALTYMAIMAVFFSMIVTGYTSGVPELNLGAMIILLFGLMVWILSAVKAYYETLRLRSEPFLGVEKIIWSLGGSFLFPGWGQFLNSQPRKGIFFFLFGAGGVFCVFALMLVKHIWPSLVISRDRYIFEIFLVWVLAFVPVVLLMWIVSVYDAFRSCEYFLRYRQRSKLAEKRVQGRGILADLVPKSSTVLGLILAISLGMQFYPKQYYLDFLKKIRFEMLTSNMTIIPELVQKTIEFLS